MSGGARGAAHRVLRNTSIRAGAELVGKFASLALMAILAREQGAEGLGVLVLALACAEIATTPVEMGFDRWFLRRVSGDRTEIDRCFWNIVRLKLARAAVLVPTCWVAVHALGYDTETRTAIYLLTLAFLLDSLSFTVFNAFMGVERGDLVGVTLAAQRLVTASLGVVVLLAGYGVVAVAGMYVAGAVVAFVLALRQLVRHVGRPERQLSPEVRRLVRRDSRPFAWHEILGIGIARLNVVVLAAFAGQAAVGYYGAAYRLLEATLFVSTALQGSFSAMFTYLHERSEPTIQAVYQRAMKLVLALLTPCAVTLAVLPGPLLELFYGPGFDGAVGSLMVVAPLVVLLGVRLLGGALMAARLDPRRLVVLYAVALGVNVAASFALIPPLGAAGAVAAMLLTEVVFSALVVRACSRAVGRPALGATAGGPLVAGAAMAAVMLLLQPVLPVALAGGAIAYVLVLVAVERRLAPADFGFVRGMLSERLPRPLAARL